MAPNLKSLVVIAEANGGTGFLAVPKGTKDVMNAKEAYMFMLGEKGSVGPLMTQAILKWLDLDDLKVLDEPVPLLDLWEEPV